MVIPPSVSDDSRLLGFVPQALSLFFLFLLITFFFLRLAAHRPPFVYRLLDVADHVEGLLGQIIVLTLDDRLEARNAFLKRHELARRACKGFGDEKRLREETLHLAGAGDDELILLGQLVHA